MLNKNSILNKKVFTNIQIRHDPKMKISKYFSVENYGRKTYHKIAKEHNWCFVLVSELNVMPKEN